LLIRRDDRPGPVDLLLGPRTHAAVQWLQIEHGLRPTGAIDLRTLGSVGLWARASHAERPAHRARTAPEGKPTSAAARPGLGGSPAGGDELVFLALLAAIGVPALAVLAVAPSRYRQRSSKSLAPHTVASARRRVAAPATPGEAARRGPITAQPAAEESRVVGYALAHEPRELERYAAAIRRTCSDRGWTLACLVRDGGAAPRRPGLAYALDRVSKEVTPRLVVGRLDHIARSVGDVAALLAWCASVGVVLVVLDVGLDTSTREGRLLARRLLAAAGREAARRAKRSPRRTGGRTNGRPADVDRAESDGT
jgi:hypothetical protein